MRKLVLAAVAMMVMAIVAAPSSVAQEAEKAEKAEATEKMEKMEKMKERSHMMKGTMTAPGEETVKIGYVLAKEEQGAKGWIVMEEDGEKAKIEMRDLAMDGDYFNYNWSPPEEADLVITCSLKKQSDGGFAGDCTDNQEEGRTGQMTMAPMEAMNPCAAEMKEKKMKEKDPSDG